MAIHPYLRLALVALPLAAALAVASWPADRAIDYLRHAGMVIPDEGRAVVLTLSPTDAQVLRSLPPTAEVPDPEAAYPDYTKDPLAWRAVHARLVDRLVQAGARAVAFDAWFTDPAPDRTAAFAAALDRAREAGVFVVLGLNDRPLDHVLYASRGAHAAVLRAIEDPWSGTVEQMALFRDLGGAEPVPSLFLQVYSLITTGRPARIEGERVVHPRGLPRGDSLWLRYMETAPARLEYRDALSLSPSALAERVRDRVVFVGVTGRWEGGELDARRVPVRPADQQAAAGIDKGATYGVFLHAHAFNQLAAWAFVHVTGPVANAVLALLAMILAGLPAVLALLTPGGATDAFQPATAGRRLRSVLRCWPWPPLAGIALVALAVASTWRAPVLYPVLGLLVTATVLAALLSVPAFQVRREASRFTRVLEEVDRLTRGQGLPPRVNLPAGGPGAVLRVLAVPAYEQAVARASVETLHGTLSEGPGGSRMLKRIPRAFFAAHGWLEPPPPAVAGDARTLEAWLSKPPERDDELTESFCVTAVRRIRNLWAHPPGLTPHATDLGRAALAARAGSEDPADAEAFRRLQRALVRDCAGYLERLAQWRNLRSEV